MITNQRRAPGAITVIDDITLYNAVAQMLLLLLLGRMMPATVGFISVGLESSFVSPIKMPIKADLTIPTPLCTLEAVFL